MPLDIATDTALDADHRVDVSIASTADIHHHADLGVATGTCCLCYNVIVASYTGIGDDPDDTRWHHADLAGVVSALFA